MVLYNGDTCAVGEWVICSDTKLQLGHVLEIVQVTGSANAKEEKADWALVHLADVTDVHLVYGMPRVQLKSSAACVQLSVSSQI